MNEPVIACTLDASSMPDRLADWRTILDHATARAVIPDGIRVTFDRGVAADELARLVVAEQECCPFFAFALTVDERGIALEVHAPADASTIVESLFGDDQSRD